MPCLQGCKEEEGGYSERQIEDNEEPLLIHLGLTLDSVLLKKERQPRIFTF